MARTTNTDTASKSAEFDTAITNAMTELQSAGFGSMTWLGTAWIETMGEMSSEVLQFIAARIKEDVKTQQAILHCKNADEMRTIQSEFVQTAIDQYTAETGKLVKIGNEMFSAAVKAKDA